MPVDDPDTPKSFMGRASIPALRRQRHKDQGFEGPRWEATGQEKMGQVSGKVFRSRKSLCEGPEAQG